MHNQEHDRALGALVGLALGDALGMPTQDLRPEVIAADYGTITGLLPAGPHQVIAAGAPAGRVTDDTEQALLFADLLISGNGLEPHAIANALRSWEDSMRARGSLDLLGPSTNRALERLRSCDPASESGSEGTTNGAAMRIAPIGIANPPGNRAQLLAAVIEASIVTHNTSIALQGAALVAGVVSAGVGGAGRGEALEYGLELSALASSAGHLACAPDLPTRTRWAITHLAARPGRAEITHDLFHVIGTSVATHESVAAAAALFAVIDDPWEALCIAASAGGDTDTVAAIAGAMFGATLGAGAFPAEQVSLLNQANELHLAEHAVGLLSRRRTR